MTVQLCTGIYVNKKIEILKYLQIIEFLSKVYQEPQSYIISHWFIDIPIRKGMSLTLWIWVHPYIPFSPQPRPGGHPYWNQSHTDDQPNAITNPHLPGTMVT